jgi:soluble P-type ATPase
MAKQGIRVSIPGHGELYLRHVISDYTGTLSYRGRLADGVWDRLHKLDELIDIHVLSADTRGTAREQLRDLPLQLHILTGKDHNVQKRDFAARLDMRNVVSFGNGANDRFLLKAVKQAGGLAVPVENARAAQRRHYRTLISSLSALRRLSIFSSTQIL